MNYYNEFDLKTAEWLKDLVSTTIHTVTAGRWK
jgi:hypothetical protein